MLLLRGVSVSVATRERKGALFSHPDWNLPSGCGLFPRKGKRERERLRRAGKKRDCGELPEREGPEKTSKVPPEER